MNYTQQELDFLLLHHEDMTAEELSRHTLHSPSSIRDMLWSKYRLHPKRVERGNRNHSFAAKLMDERDRKIGNKTQKQ